MNTAELEQALVGALAYRADRTTVPAGVAFDGRRPTASPRPRWNAPAVAAAAAAVLVAGLVAVGSRNDGASGDTTVPTTPMVAAVPDDGRLALPEELGFRGWRAGDTALNQPRLGVNQLFATAAAAPETEPSLVVMAVPGDREFVPWAQPELDEE